MTNDVETIKQRLDIVDVVRDYLTLKQSGSHFKTTCPFHHEKSPSFMVNRERQIWHCFGCNEGGDIFTFVQRIENIDFREALRLLAEKAGIELTTSQRSEINRNEKTRYLDILQTAATVYHRILCEVAGASGAREYLARRDVSEAMIKQFQIGFSPPAWDLMTQHLLKKNFALDDCAKAGVTIVKTEGRTRAFDRFRGRIMFPISDTHGRVIGFTGRILIETKDSGGKYVNTPETPLFHKGTVIYALDRAKAAIKEKGFVVLVEGQMDVIACHQIGMTNVVACSGTALTDEQLHLLKRYTEELRMAFDTDAAGQHAAIRSMPTAVLKNGFTLKVIQIPNDAGKDADECIKKNQSVWCDAVENARPFIEVMMGQVFPEDEIKLIRNDSKIKKERIEKIAAIIALLPSNFDRDFWVQKAALFIGSSITNELKDFVEKSRTQQQNALQKNDGKDVQLEKKAHKSQQMRALLEERIMALLQEEFQLVEEVSALVDPSQFLESAHVSLYKAWRTGYTADTAPQTRTILMTAPVKDSTLELLLSAVYSDLGPTERQTELRTLTKRLREIYLTEQRDSLIREIQQAETAGNVTRVSELLERYQKLIS